MENIYTLEAKFAEISDRYDSAEAALVEEYENNGGEVTEQTEAMERALSELAEMKQEIIDSVLAAPDEYAAIVKNAEAQKKVLEAQLKAVKEEQARIIARLQAKINRKTGKIDYFKDCIASALQFAGIEKVGGAKTDNQFSIYFSKTTAVEVEDADKILAPYQPRITAFIASLPSYIVVKTDISKSELKKADEMPEGASKKENRSLQIR